MKTMKDERVIRHRVVLRAGRNHTGGLTTTDPTTITIATNTTTTATTISHMTLPGGGTIPRVIHK